jgi:hypothetical protein
LWVHSLAISKARERSRLAYDLPIPLGRSPLIGGSTTLKASDPRGTGVRIPSLRLPLSSINARRGDRLPVYILARRCIPDCIWAAVLAAGSPLGSGEACVAGSPRWCCLPTAPWSEPRTGSSRACGAPVHVSSQKGGVMWCPCCLGTKESHSDLFKIDTPLYPHIAAVHGGKCSVLIRAPVR